MFTEEYLSQLPCELDVRGNVHVEGAEIFLRFTLDDGRVIYDDLMRHPEAVEEVVQVLTHEREGSDWFYKALVRHGKPACNRGGYYPLSLIFAHASERVGDAAKPESWVKRRRAVARRVLGLKEGK